MKSRTILALLFSAHALAQSTGGHDGFETFPINLAGFTQDIDNIQASAVSFSGNGGVLALSCGSPHCPLTPSPTLTLDSTAYRLNLGTVATQSCTPTFTNNGDSRLTLVCMESTSGVDDASHTMTYSGQEIHYGTVTLTGGLDKFSSALSSLSVAESSASAGLPVSTGAVLSTSPAISTSGGLPSTGSITSNAQSATDSASTSTTSSASSQSNAAGMISANHGATWMRAVAGMFACAFF
ncbi:MAG: hypothetical protein GOMPHAMPRED_002359 [Gomphillus americanus]|uniref:Uncharacterized protein n=1 Tax=Gomphillus americanus TaxID=1940652 RepID=A0A8H3FDK7_9LECA|nr:MAG: hypothetical protein GOMPHAMPRED_002359 [Gomphillus americanus]